MDGDRNKRSRDGDTEETIEEALQRACRKLPPVYHPVTLFDTATFINNMAFAQVAGDVSTYNPRLIDEFDYGEGPSLQILFRGQPLGPVTAELVTMKHMAKSYGFDYLIKFEDGYLMCSNVRESEGYIYDGRKKVKTLDTESVPGLIDFLMEVGKEEGLVSRKAIYQEFSHLITTAAKLGDSSKKEVITILGQLTEQCDGRTAQVELLVQHVAANITGHVQTNNFCNRLAALLTPAVSLSDLIGMLKEFKDFNQAVNIMNHHPEIGAPITKTANTQYCTAEGVPLEAMTLREVGDDVVVACAKAYTTTVHIANISMDMPVYVLPADGQMRVAKKGKAGQPAEIGREIAVKGTLAGVLKTISSMNDEKRKARPSAGGASGMAAEQQVKEVLDANLMG